jgi:hypothetical protein
MQQLGLVAVKEQEISNLLHRHVYFYHTFSLMAKHSAQHDSVQHEAKQISNAKQMTQHLAQQEHLKNMSEWLWAPVSWTAQEQQCFLAEQQQRATVLVDR